VKGRKDQQWDIIKTMEQTYVNQRRDRNKDISTCMQEKNKRKLIRTRGIIEILYIANSKRV
jgi:hypothetical protein